MIFNSPKTKVALISLLFIGFQVQAQFTDSLSLSGTLNALRVAVPFLTIAPDSRSAGMGDAGVATTPDANSQHWNPAKFAFIQKEWGVAFSYTPWLRNLVNDINLTYLAGYYRLDKEQVISGSMLYFSMGDITFTNDENVVVQHHNPNEFSFDVAYSRKFANLISGGIAFRYIRSDLTGGFSQQGQAAANAGTAFAADVSVYYQQPLVIDNKNAEAAFGLNISNIGSKISYNNEATKDFIPINMRIGGRFTIDFDTYNSMSFVVDANKLLVPTPPYKNPDTGEIISGKDPNVSIAEGMLQSFYDAPGGAKEELHEISYALGTEYWYSKQFALRAGYFGEHETKGNRKYFTIGAGLKYNVFTLDFAYLIPTAGFNSPISNTKRFTLLFNFEPARNRQKVE